MAGEDQYINPIIQAMISSAQLAQSAQGQKNQVAQQKVADAQRDKMIQQEQDRLQEEHDYHNATIKNATDLLQAHLAQAHNETAFQRIQNFKDLSDLQAIGVNIGKLFPGQPTNNLPQTGNPEIDNDPSLTQQTVSLPGNPGDQQNIPLSAFPNPDEATSHQAQLLHAASFAKTQGEMEAMAPYTATANSFTEKLRKQEADAAMQRTLAQGANAERVAGIRTQAEQDIANARNAVENHRTELEYGFGEGSPMADIAANAEEAGVNGEQDPSKQPANLRRGIAAAAAAKGDVIPTDFKAYTAALTGAKVTQGLLDQARDIANQFSSDSKGNSFLGNAVKQHFGFTDVGSAVDSLESQVNTVAKSLGINRTSNAEMDRTFKGLFSPTRSTAQNLQNIDKAAHQLNIELEQQFPANIPASQKNRALRNRGIVDLGGYQDKGNTPGATGYIRNKKTGSVVPDTPQNRQLIGLDPDAQIPLADQ